MLQLSNECFRFATKSWRHVLKSTTFSLHKILPRIVQHINHVVCVLCVVCSMCCVFHACVLHMCVCVWFVCARIRISIDVAALVAGGGGRRQIRNATILTHSFNIFHRNRNVFGVPSGWGLQWLRSPADRVPSGWDP